MRFSSAPILALCAATILSCGMQRPESCGTVLRIGLSDKPYVPIAGVDDRACDVVFSTPTAQIHVTVAPIDPLKEVRGTYETCDDAPGTLVSCAADQGPAPNDCERVPGCIAVGYDGENASRAQQLLGALTFDFNVTCGGTQVFAGSGSAEHRECQR